LNSVGMQAFVLAFASYFLEHIEYWYTHIGIIEPAPVP
jgi:hypothetical protein